LLTISSIKPEEILVSTKLILVGTMETYDLLYEYDPDFKKIFKLKVEYDPIVNCTKKNKETLKSTLHNLCLEKDYKLLSDSCYNKIAKYLARKAENRDKVLFDINIINDILILSNNKARKLNKNNIDEECLVFPDNNNAIIRKKIDEMYKNRHILVSVTGTQIGQVNGLSVIDLNYFVFGKPIRITCTCYKGEGQIIDVQKESELSGKIHSKAVNTLMGLLNNLVDNYSKLPVNLHLSFEQIYGMVDGDSASVAEFLTIVSSMSKVPIKQNIGVTGSLNQFGEVQSIGGTNEKIEGFYNTCQVIDSVKDKGVLIPNTNKNDLVLDDKIEKSISLDEFHIYTMENIRDAIEVMMGDYDEVLMKLKKELKKYSK
jgi:predicted ATP-dependent protease